MKTKILLVFLLAVGLQSYAQQVQLTAVKNGSAIKTQGLDSTVLILLNGEKITEANMQALSKNSIESITVLKDASATAIYGIAGKNGVVLIKTKGATGTKQITTFKLDSLSENAPLYVVDGIKLSKTEMKNVSPDDIISISVLKDAQTILLYGAEGAKGVIEITTKSGKKAEKK